MNSDTSSDEVQSANIWKPGVQNPWREEIENVIKGDNHFRSGDWYRLLEDLDALYAAQAKEQTRLNEGRVQVLLTDAQIDAITDQQWGKGAAPNQYMAHRACARAVLKAAHRKVAALTEEQIQALCYTQARSDARLDQIVSLVRAVEAAHGITTPKAKP